VGVDLTVGVDASWFENQRKFVMCVMSSKVA